VASWWWFPRKPQHVGAVLLILKCFNSSTLFNVVCICWILKCWTFLPVLPVPRGTATTPPPYLHPRGTTHSKKHKHSETHLPSSLCPPHRPQELARIEPELPCEEAGATGGMTLSHCHLSTTYRTLNWPGIKPVSPQWEADDRSKAAECKIHLQ